MSWNCSHLSCFQFYYISLHVLYYSKCVSSKISGSAFSWNQPKTLKIAHVQWNVCATLMGGSVREGFLRSQFGLTGRHEPWAHVERRSNWAGSGVVPVFPAPATALNPPSLLPQPCDVASHEPTGAWPGVAGFRRGRKLRSGWRGPRCVAVVHNRFGPPP